MSDKPDVRTYEELYAQLQETVTRMESGELSLEESLHLYEQGVQLATTCQKLLDAAELRVQTLQGAGI